MTEKATVSDAFVQADQQILIQMPSGNVKVVQIKPNR